MSLISSCFAPQLPSDSPACELCELLVQTIDQYLKDNKTEAAINATVYKLCNDLPDTLKTTVRIICFDCYPSFLENNVSCKCAEFTEANKCCCCLQL